MKKRVKLHGFLIFFSVALVAIFPKVFLQLNYSLVNIFTDILGVIFLTFGFLLRISARGLKSELSQKGNSLVKEGLYSQTRNPMYLGISLIALGIVLLVFRYWVLILFAAFFVLMYLRLTFKEEKALLEKFGAEYSQYQKKVPRFFPVSPKIIRNFPLKKEWFSRELSSIIPLVAAILLYKIWQMIRV